VLQDGHPVKRYVIVGDVLSRLKDGVAAVQVLDGLQPGELVITG